MTELQNGNNLENPGSLIYVIASLRQVFADSIRDFPANSHKTSLLIDSLGKPIHDFLEIQKMVDSQPII